MFNYKIVEQTHRQGEIILKIDIDDKTVKRLFNLNFGHIVDLYNNNLVYNCYICLDNAFKYLVMVLVVENVNDEKKYFSKLSAPKKRKLLQNLKKQLTAVSLS